jgi:hypothetical protein
MNFRQFRRHNKTQNTMSEENKPAAAPVKKAATKPATKPAKKTRAPRVIDPAVESIRAEAKAKIKALAGARASNGILQTIIAKRLPQLTLEHKQVLFDELAKTCVPSLFKQVENAN